MHTTKCLLQGFLRSTSQEGLVVSSTLARDEEHIREMWHLREHISVALTQKGNPHQNEHPLNFRHIPLFRAPENMLHSSERYLPENKFSLLVHQN